MGAFLSGLFGGSSPGLSTAQSTAAGGAQYGFNTGEQNENAAGGYYNGILSGDPTKIAQSLAPALTANSQQAQQKKETTAQFGTRSGGNTAASDAIDSGTRANTVNLIGGALNGAAAGAAGLGENQVASGTQNNAVAGSFSQQELMNMMNSIFGKGISSGVGSLEGAGLGAVGI